MRQAEPPQSDKQQPQRILPPAMSEEQVTNIVGQIDPQRILDNLNHALKGEYYDKERGRWVKVGEELINDAGRGYVISFMTSILNNASTMGTIDEKQFSGLMKGVIETVTREFKYNLERFGFVPKGEGYEKGDYQNKGTPDTSRMTTVAEMIYQRAFIVYSRSIKGSESKRIFKSTSLRGELGSGQNNKKGFFSRLFGR